MGKKSTPDAPDYTGAAQQTAAGNLQLAQQATQANRPDIVTPFGTSTWSQNGDNWTNNITLTPEQQSSLDAQMQVQNGQSQLANQLQGQVAQQMGTLPTMPQLSDYIGNGPQLNSNFSGYGGSGNNVNLNYSPYQNTSGQASMNYYGFNPGNAGTVSGNFSGYSPTSQAAGGFTGPNVSGVPSVNSNFDQLQSNVPAAQAGFSGFGGSSTGVDLSAPQFSDANAQAGAQSAYNSATALLQPQMQQDTKQLDEQLRLQGLTPGSEAYNNAAQNLSRTQGQQLNQIANQSVITGNNMANQNYASQLAGYNAGNSAQAQDYSQLFNNYGTGQTALANNNAVGDTNFQRQLSQGQFNSGQQQAGNAAQNQSFSQALGLNDANNNSIVLGNQAQNQNFSQGLAANQSQNDATAQRNAAQQQQYAQMLQGYQTGQDAITNRNAAQNQNFNQSMAGQQFNQTAANNYNTAQAQQFGQGLGQYQTYQDAINAANSVQQQQYQNNLNNYNTARTSAQQDYLLPLNALNSVLSGQQVSMPQFQQTGGSMATVGGPDYLSAANMAGQYSLNAQQLQNSAAGGIWSMLGGMGGSALSNPSLFSSDIRLKDNIKFLGTSSGGHNVYRFTYKADPSTEHIGVMAQEVLEKQPSAVFVDGDGMYMVDYAQIH